MLFKERQGRGQWITPRALPHNRLFTFFLILGLFSSVLLGPNLTVSAATPPNQTQPRAAQYFVYDWGQNQYGQLGNGSTANSSTPVVANLPGGVTPTTIAAGAFHTLAIGSDNKLYAWGYNAYGQLGNGTANNSTTPVAITLANGVTPAAISGGAEHTIAIGSDNKLYTWGYNKYGELGNNTTTDSTTPIAITLAIGVTPKTATAGAFYNMAIGSDNKLYAWGNNFYGELGNNTTTDSHTPVVVTLANGVTPKAISAGQAHTLAIGSDNKLYAWGNNYFGQLGNGTTTDSHTPVVITLASGVTPTAISAGQTYSVAIGSDNKLYGWGDNSSGQLGDGTTTDSTTPIAANLPGGVTPTAISAVSSLHTLAIGSDGKLYAWGDNTYGELGNGTTTDSHSPTVVPNVAGITKIAAGSYHSVIIGSNATPTTTNLSSSTNPSMVGQNVTFTATVAPSAASGIVTFTDGVNTLGTGTLAGGVATFSTSTLSVGTHNIVATYAGISSYTGSSSNTVAQVVNPTTYTYYLPQLANAANTPLGNTTTYLTFQNLAPGSSATVSVQYYNLSTGAASTSDSLSIVAKGQKAIQPSIVANSSATGIITSNQPLNVVVSEAISGGGSAYTVSSRTASSLYSALALNGAFGGFNTNLVIFNTANTASTGLVQFYDENGNPSATQSFNIPSHASQVLAQAGLSGLSSSHSYWAKITATNSSDALTAQVVELGPSNFVTSFQVQTASQAAQTFYAPAAFNGLYGFVTGIGFANPNPAAANLTVSYYDISGNSLGSQGLTIAANGNGSLYQGVTGTPANVASAVVSSTQPIVMTVNERGSGANTSGTYVGVSGGSTSVALPVVANGFAGFVSGTTLLNTGSTGASVSVTYLDGNGNVVGNAQSTTSLAPHASLALYQGAASQGLPGNYFGTALVSSNQPLLVTTNALQTGGLFYTYTEPTQ